MKRWTCLVLLLIGAGLLAAPPGLLAAKPFTDDFTLDECDFTATGRNRYFILEPAHKLVLEGKDGRKFARVEVTVLDETKTVMGIETRIVEEREFEDSQLHEVSHNYFALCRQNNSVFYFGEDVDIYKNGAVASHEGAWLAGENGARPGLFMPGLALVGARYVQEIAPGVAMDRAEILSLNEVVTTPAGTFKNAMKTRETNPLEWFDKELSFYAPGIGVVQEDKLKLVEVVTANGSH